MYHVPEDENTKDTLPKGSTTIPDSKTMLFPSMVHVISLSDVRISFTGSFFNSVPLHELMLPSCSTIRLGSISQPLSGSENMSTEGSVNSLKLVASFQSS